MGGDKNCHGIELAHWQTSCIAGLNDYGNSEIISLSDHHVIIILLNNI